MSAATNIRLGLAITACVGVLVLALVWGMVPAVIEPCSLQIAADDAEQPFALGTCLRRPSTMIVILKVTMALLSIAGVAALAAKAVPKRKLASGGVAAALSALVGLTTIQAISRQVFNVGYVPPLEDMTIVGIVFFLFGALVVLGLQKWWGVTSTLNRNSDQSA